jgi:hypothetical protein
MSTTIWQEFSIKIVRFDTVFPLEQPDSYVVGFNVMHKTNGRSKYLDIRIPFTDTSGKTDEQVTQSAWTQLQPSFLPWAKSVNTMVAPIIGSDFTP